MILSVVIPVFDERATLGTVLAQAAQALPKVPKEIIVVDDCSKDGTREWLRANVPTGSSAGSRLELDSAGNLAFTPGGETPNIILRVHYHESNSGKGACLRSGLALAAGEVVVIQDADLEYDPTDWPVMYDLIAQRRVADVVSASQPRRHWCAYSSAPRKRRAR